MTLLIWTSITLGVVFGSTLAINDAPVISTEGGRVSGVAERSTEGKAFYSYYGIPFAQPPLGELRFKDPVVSSGWTGVRSGSSMPMPCVGIPFGLMVLGVKLPAEQIPGTEDCLYLNVFMPQTAAAVAVRKKGTTLPVMVYIHGGAFFGGAAQDYLPHVLLNKDIVLVVIQYRLGFLGFMSTEDSIIPGNFGLKDQTLALQWIQRNIQNFGGDPKRVTIFGESAGAASVHFQMLSPKAKGLFNQAIMQSGSALAPWATRVDHKRVAARVGSVVGCNLDQGSQAFLACMQSVNAKNIHIQSQDLLEWFLAPMLAVPRVDGVFLPDHPAKLLAEGRFNKVNIMSGVTAQEGASVTQPLYNVRRELLEVMKARFSYVAPLALMVDDEEPIGYTREIFNYYLGGPNIDTPFAEDMTQMISDILFNLGNDVTTLYHAREKGISTYRYVMEHRGQLSFGDFMGNGIGSHWVTHGDDLYYLFERGPLLTPPNQPAQRSTTLTTHEDLCVRNIMVSTWTNFATYGNPTPDYSLGFRWEAATEDNFQHLTITVSPSMKPDLQKETRRFLLSLPTRTNFNLNPLLLKDEDLYGDRCKKEEL